MFVKHVASDYALNDVEGRTWTASTPETAKIFQPLRGTSP